MSNLPPPINLTQPLPARPEPDRHYTSKEKEQTQIIEQMRNYWNNLIPLHRVERDTLYKALEPILPIEKIKTAKKEALKVFMDVVRYDPYHDSIAVKLLDENSEILTIKHRTKKGFSGKWIAYKGSRANANAQIRIVDNLEPVFILEGTHDYLTAILLGINFIALPYKHYMQFTPNELETLKKLKHPKHNFDFVFLPDMDNGNIPTNTIASLYWQLEPLGDVITNWNIHKKFEWTRKNPKADFSDILTLSPAKTMSELKSLIVGEHYF